METTMHVESPTLSVALQKLLYQLTQQKDTNTALQQVLQRYVQLETEYWTNQDLAFRQKWNMDFEAFVQLYEPSSDMEKLNEYHLWDNVDF